MLRELLLADFGIDLPIHGRSSDRNDPLCIETTLPERASRIQMDFVRCIFRRLNFHWRTVAKERLSINGRDIEKLTHEVRYVEDGNVVAERRSHYFDVSMAMPASGDTTPHCHIDLGEAAPFNPPYQLGWMNYSSITTYEALGPGMGLSLLYGAPFSKVTVYIYDKEMDQIDCRATPALFHDEFALAVDGLAIALPQAVPVKEAAVEDLLFKSFVVDSDYTCVMLMTAMNHFIKVRATIGGSEDKYVFDCLMESLSDIAAWVRWLGESGVSAGDRKLQ